MSKTSKTDHLPKVKKVTAKKLPRIKPTLTHCYFVNENGNPVTDQPTASVQGLERVKTKKALEKLFPVELVVLMVDKNTNVLDVVSGRVGSMSQLSIMLRTLDKDKKSKEEAEEVA